MPENDQMPPTPSEQQAVDEINRQSDATNQGDGSGEVPNEQAQQLVDSGEATPGPEEKEPAPV